MRKKIVAGNWKMNLTSDEAKNLANALAGKEIMDGTRVLIFPSALFISSLTDIGIEVGTQNFYFEPKGAFTGEMSISQFKSIGCNIGLIGHSERRMYFAETNAILKQKVDSAIAEGFEFIFCCGEPINIRETGRELDFVKGQLEESLFHLTGEEMKKAIIAYEPIWAIGTGLTASSSQAEDMHAAIRGWIAEFYSLEIANSVSILYGGSCNPSNANELFSCPNVDGGLIGGASLDAESFTKIIQSF